MKDLSIEEMASVGGGFAKFNKATVVAKDNSAFSMNVASFDGTANRSGGIGEVYQSAEANAGNQHVDIDQSL